MARFVPGWRAVGQTVVHTDLHWVMVAGVVGLLLTTFPEISRWRKVGCKFIWTSLFDLSLRLAFLVLLLIGSIIILPVFSLGLGGWLTNNTARLPIPTHRLRRGGPERLSDWSRQKRAW